MPKLSMHVAYAHLPCEHPLKGADFAVKLLGQLYAR